MRPENRIECILGDITTEDADAIVNAANEGLRGGGGVDGAIHRAAGPGLLQECRERHPGGCPTGDSRVTKAYDLPARWVIHTVGPIYRGGDQGEAEALRSAHRTALEAAEDLGARLVAFPAISCGVYGYPHPQAAAIAVATVGEFLLAPRRVERVRFVLFNAPLLRVFRDARERLFP